MTVSNVSANSSSALYTPPARPEATEKQVNGRDARNDGDKDDAKKVSQSQSASPSPSVNAQGQVVGSLLNAKA
jgi:hypothetical protein